MTDERKIDTNYHGNEYAGRTEDGAKVSFRRFGTRIHVVASAALTAEEADDLAYNLRCAAAAARLYPTVGEP